MKLYPARESIEAMMCDDLKDRIDIYGNFFNDFVGDTSLWGSAPKIDMSETKKDIVVRAELPGMDAKDIDLTIDSGILTISGQKRFESEEEEMNSFCRETSYGYFRRSVELPADVDSEKVNADYRSGVLKIKLPKLNGKDKKVIKIAAH
jgi:HSP20 family protein